MNGAPYLADLANAALYPIGLLFNFLPLSTLGFTYSYYAIHLAIGAFFFYLFLKEIGCHKIVAISTSLIYLLSVHMGGLRKSHIVIIVTIIYLPVILYFVERYFKTYSRKHLLSISIAMALQFYSGFIQNTVYTFVVVFFYALVLAIYKRKELKISKFFVDALSLGVVFVGLSSAQLFPALHMQAVYVDWGSVSGSTLAFFQSWSTHFINLLSMLFPRFWGANVHMPLWTFAYSEMDIELFLGLFVLSFVIYGAIQLRSHIRIKLAIAIMVLTFIFSSHAQIPTLSRFLFMVPVIGDFRVPARILFVFIFFAYVIFALTLSEMAKKEAIRNNYLNFVKKYATALLGLIVVFTLPVLSNLALQENLNPGVSEAFSHFRGAFFSAAVIALILLAASYLWPSVQCKIPPKFNGLFIGVTCVLIVISTVIETFAFSSQTHPQHIAPLFEDEAVQTLQYHIGHDKVLVAGSMSSVFGSILAVNSNVLVGIPTINTYQAFNNPNLFRSFSHNHPPQINASGALIEIPNIEEIIVHRNDLLSMLGVRYIIDPDFQIPEAGKTIVLGETQEPLYHVDTIRVVGMTNQTFVYSHPVIPTPNAYYWVTFDIETQSSPETFWVDWYSTSPERPERQYVSPFIQTFSIEPGQSSFGGFIYTGNEVVDDLILFRIVTVPTSDMYITNLTIVEATAQENTYVPFLANENIRIFENTNAREILFTPQYTRIILDREDIFRNPYSYHLSNGSYIEGFRDMNLDGINTSIEVLSLANNSITANVTTDEPSFINFSQNYFPGWRAYVNGRRTEVHMVNALIMGIEIPAGQSMIEFKFTSPAFLAGGTITGLTLLAIGLVIFWDQKRCESR